MEMSRKSTSIWLALKTTIAMSITVARMLGMNIFFPDRIHKPMIISTAPNKLRRTGSETIPSVKEGKYPIHAKGLKNADIAG